MNLQVIEGANGKPAGVFIPMNDWATIKSNYPDVENLSSTIPDWQKQLLDSRLDTINRDPNSVLPIDGLFDELDRE